MSKLYEQLLNLYNKKNYGKLITKAIEILRDEGLIIAKRPLIYEIEKQEGYAHSYLVISMYVGAWRVYMKIDDADNIEKGVSR